MSKIGWEEKQQQQQRMNEEKMVAWFLFEMGLECERGCVIEGMRGRSMRGRSMTMLLRDDGG